MAAKSRVAWIDTGRGIAIVLVALYHSARWLTKAGFDTHGWQFANEILSSLRMPLFFTLSGLFAGKWLYSSWRDLLRSKLMLFIWVFLIWEFIGSCAFVLGTALNGHRVSLRDTAMDLLISPVVPKLELWFIWALTLFFVTAKLCRNVNKWIQLVLTGLLAAFSLTVWLNTTTGATGSAKYYFFFLVGIYLRSIVMAFGDISRPLLMVSVFFAWAAVSISLSVLGIRDVFGLYFVNCILGVFAGITLSRLLSRVAILGRIGKQTLPIYLAHTPIIIVTAFILSVIPVASLESRDIIVTPLTGVFAVTLSLLLYTWCSRNWARFLYTPPLELLDRALANDR